MILFPEGELWGRRLFAEGVSVEMSAHLLTFDADLPHLTCAMTRSTIGQTAQKIMFGELFLNTVKVIAV